MNFLWQLRQSTVMTPLFPLSQQPVSLNQISVPPSKEEIEHHFSYPKQTAPDLISPLFGIIIPLLMIVFNRKGEVEMKPIIPSPRYLNLEACIRKMKSTLIEIKPLIAELILLEGGKSQKWSLAVYEDYTADLNEHLQKAQNNRGDDKKFFILEQDIQYFVKEIKKEHRLKYRGKDHLLNDYRLFSKNNPGAVDQNRSFLASYRASNS